MKRVRNSKKEKNEYIDLILRDERDIIGIELKYVTAEFRYTFGKESFYLTNQRATDVRCYDTLKDIQRLENYAKCGLINIGYSIILTNVSHIWKQKLSKKENFYDEFRIYDGRTVSGRLNWMTGTSEGTKMKRETPIELRGKYTFYWDNYIDLKQMNDAESSKNYSFKYAIVKVR